MSLLPPFFGGLMAYDAEANIAFDCPGHQGGQFYRKSPAGQLFFKHFGESIFRNDLCNADVELGDLLIHEGAAAEAQTSRRAGVRRRPDLLRAERHEHVEQGRHQRGAAARRPGAVRPQQPQVAAPGRAGAGRRDSDLPADRAQPVRHDRRGRLGRVGREVICASRSARTRSSRTRSGTTRRGRSAWPASSSRPTTARSTTCARSSRRSGTCATTCSGTRRGSATTRSIRCSRTTARCGSRTWAGHAGAVLHAVGAQAGRRLLAGVADPQARRAHPRPEALRRAQALQRIVPDERLDLAVLSAVRLARREREDSRGQGRRDALGPLHRAGHRGAQEAARSSAATTRRTGKTAEEQWFFDPFVPDVVTIRGSKFTDGRRPTSPWEDRADRRAQARAAVLELPPRAHVARLLGLRRRLRDGRSRTSSRC